MKIYSSGGVGDALIVGLKINRNDMDASEWHHFEKHSCHCDAIRDIQKKFVANYKTTICDKPEKEAQENCKNETYLNTKVPEIDYPYLGSPLSNNYFNESLRDFSDYIVVQAQAGRMHDNTRREVSLGVISQLFEHFPNKKIVLIGPEHNLTYTNLNPRLLNLTGKTNSVLDTFDIINKCSLFIGQDGVCAYYAMMIKKPTLVAYHLSNLVMHYFHERWQEHSFAVVGAGNILDKLPRLKLRQFVEDNYENNKCEE